MPLYGSDQVDVLTRRMHDAALARRNSTVFVPEGDALPGGGDKGSLSCQRTLGGVK
jgi:hypothetical protein